MTYNYDTQRWTDDPELEARQLAEDLILLTGPQGRDYARFVGLDYENALVSSWRAADGLPELTPDPDVLSLFGTGLESP